jgi:hypothetical protein
LVLGTWSFFALAFFAKPLQTFPVTTFLRLSICLIAFPLFAAPLPIEPLETRGVQFIGLKSFSSFKESPGKNPNEIVLTSPEFAPLIKWDELIASWDVQGLQDAYLKVEARGISPAHTTKYFTMSLWSADPARHPRASVSNQKDPDGDVSADTLSLKQLCDRVQIRLTLGGSPQPKLKLLGLSLLDSKAAPPSLPPNQAAWGMTIPVPERSQMAYPNGKVLCSPTTVSMIMTYWSRKLQRPELDHDVPDVVNAVYDSNWKGAGNWPLNTAYAGSYNGMKGYVTRMTDISELEDWIAAGLPVGLSVCYDRLRGKGPGPNGHLVVLVGFTKTGDPIINDPGTSVNVRKVFPRKNLAYAWANSRNAAYLIYTEDAEIPRDRFGHWDSWSAHQRTKIGKPRGQSWQAE